MATPSYKFISQPDPNLHCSICLDLASQSKQCEDCGKLFCSECIEKNGRNPCPNCRANNPRYFKDVKSGRDIKSIGVRCANMGNGCTWTGTIGTLDNHVSVCEYTEVACTYESLGCGVRMLRKDIKKHETEINTGHFNLMLPIVQSLSEQHKTLSQGEALVFKVPGYASKKGKGEIFYSTPVYTHPGGYKIRFKVYANGISDGAGTHVSVFTEILQGHYDNQLKWPFLGKVTYELLNQLIDGRHYRRVLTFDGDNDMRVGCSLGYPKFLPHSALCHDSATSTEYLLDDALYFRVSVKVDDHKPWLTCTDKLIMGITSVIDSKTTLKNGESFTFTITGYNTWRADNVMFYSDTFCTRQCGYKMCIYVYANGEDAGKGTHVSAHSKLLEGSYDASLLWPFQGTVTLTLLNQISDENHHTKTVEFKPIHQCKVGNSLDYSQFISQSALSHDPVKNTQYLKNDTLYFRVSVKEKTCKSWLTCTYN